MIYSSDKTLEDQIIEILVSNSVTTNQLYDQVLKRHPNKVTLHAVYKVVNKLIDSNVIVKAKKKLIISNEWKQSAISQLGQNTSPILAAGETVTYSFTSLAHLDAYWKTIMLQASAQSESCPVFFCSSHNFWWLINARAISEKAYYDSFTQNQIYGFYSITEADKVDKSFKKEFSNKYFKINTGIKTSIKPTRHITVINDLVITVQLTSGTTMLIDDLYKKSQTKQEVALGLEDILSKNQKVKLKIENNIIKARSIRKSLSKDFLIPDEIKNWVS